jgi:hypothetical protein
MMNKIPNGPAMIGYFFRKRQRLSDQPSHPLAHEGVKTLDMLGFSTVFPDRPMP